MPATSRTTSSAKNPVPSRKPRSSALLREDGVFTGFFSMRSEADALQGVHLQSDDLRRKRRVAEIGAVLLAFGQRPLHEIHHDLRPLLVSRMLVEQQPREG